MFDDSSGAAGVTNGESTDATAPGGDDAVNVGQEVEVEADGGDDVVDDVCAGTNRCGLSVGWDGAVLDDGNTRFPGVVVWGTPRSSLTTRAIMHFGSRIWASCGLLYARLGLRDRGRSQSAADTALSNFLACATVGGGQVVFSIPFTSKAAIRSARATL